MFLCWSAAALAFGPPPSRVRVIDEGDGWAVAFKPPGVTVHDGEGSLLATLRPLVDATLRPVHRLDRDAFGACLRVA